MPKWGASKAVAIKPEAARSVARQAQPDSTRSPARQALADHQATVAAIRAEYDAAAEAIERLRQVIDQETAAEAASAQLHQDHADLLARWSERGGTGPLPLPDAAQHAKAEAALAQARRSAAAARSAITEKEAVMMASGAKLVAAIEQAQTLKTAVLIEAADTIGSKYLATFRQLVALAARLHGLNETLLAGGYRSSQAGLPEIGIAAGMLNFGQIHAPGFAVGTLSDEATNDPSWVAEANRWRDLFERLDADPHAEFVEV